MSVSDEKRFQIANETFKLLTASIDALARTMTVQKDENVNLLINQAMFKQMEARYWLSEALGVLDAQNKPVKPGN